MLWATIDLSLPHLPSETTTSPCSLPRWQQFSTSANPPPAKIPSQIILCPAAAVQSTTIPHHHEILIHTRAQLFWIHHAASIKPCISLIAAPILIRSYSLINCSRPKTNPIWVPKIPKLRPTWPNVIWAPKQQLRLVPLPPIHPMTVPDKFCRQLHNIWLSRPPASPQPTTVSGSWAQTVTFTQTPFNYNN